jgi:hypothetical protein
MGANPQVFKGEVTMKIILLVLFCFVAHSVEAAPSREDQLRGLTNEYRDLAEVCLENESQECCLSSVRTMAQGNYKPADFSGAEACPEGFKINTQKCEDAYQWCEPKKEEVQ